ncbi:MAG: autotransporter domain-containing protein [Candidatus Berkiella sp.]
MKQALRLTQAVLASTLFVIPSLVLADQIVSTQQTNVSFTTGAPDNKGNIQVTNTGQILVNTAAVNNGDAILVNTENTFVTLDPNNAMAGNNALLTQIAGQGRNGITITGGDGASITVGANTGISAVADGILADSQLITVANSGNIVGATGIEVTANGTSFSLTNQGSGTVTGNTNQGLVVNGPNAIIDNFGTVTGAGGIVAGGQNVSITNETTGQILSNTAVAGITANAINLSLLNSGLIKTTAAGSDAILLNQNFTTVTNNSTGTINSATSNGIHLSGAISGAIQNSGLITTSTVGAQTGAIFIDGAYTGSITNNAGGIIESTAGGGLADAIAIKGSFSSINNSGTIQAVAGGFNDTAITVYPTSTAGTINNSGLIQSATNATIVLGGNITQINNTGQIISQAGGTPIVADQPNVTLTGGINNSGTITSIGADAIDLQFGGAGINVKLTQNGGTITGDVKTASAGGSIFDINGGTINGDVITGGGAVQSTLNLNGGTINGDLNLFGALGDTVNLNGSAVQDINTGPGADIFNLTAGTFTNINGGVGDTLNVLSTFSTTGDILAVPTVNVKAGTFTVNNKLTDFTNLNVGPNATMVVNSTDVDGVAGGAAVVINSGSSITVTADNQLDTGAGGTTGSITVNNGGSLNLNNSATPGAITNTYTQQAGGNYGVVIQGPGDYAKMTVGVGGATLNAGSFVTAQLGTGQFIPTGTQFDIITGGPVADASTLNQPYSLTVQFDKTTVGGNILRLTAQRNAFSNFANTDASQGVAGALDTIALLPPGSINPQILAVLGQLDLIGNQATLVEELESLAPPVNYALIKASRVSMDQMFRSITRRIEDMRNLKTLGAESYMIIGPADMEDRGTGYNYGDSVYSAGNKGAWVQGYGAILDQHKRNQVDGYLGDAAGVAFGMDWGRQGALVGAALNFTQVHMVGRTTDENVQNLQSVQGSVYSWLDLTDALYLDTQVGFASNHYKTRRNIGVGTVTTAGFADFFGVNYGVQAEMGYAFLYDFLTVAPVARVRYTRMALDDYSEQGAGGLSLTVNQQGLNEGIAGIGLRMLGKKEFAQAVYAPEVSVMLAYDFYADEQSVQSRFLGGGPLFTTTGIKPPHKILLVDAGVNVHTYDAYIFTVKGELEMRDHYYGYSGWVQLYRSW